MSHKLWPIIAEILKGFALGNCKVVKVVNINLLIHIKHILYFDP